MINFDDIARENNLQSTSGNLQSRTKYLGQNRDIQ